MTRETRRPRATRSLQPPSAEAWPLIAQGFDHLDQGLSVFDRDLRLAFFNRAFADLLAFPPELLYVGVPFETLIRFNAERGDYGDGAVDDQVAERVSLARRFEAHEFRRVRPDGTVLEIRGFPLDGGGFVTTYADITGRTRAETRFEDAVEGLAEGFMLWDADDRLVACNGRVRELYPGLEDLLEPGRRFEDNLRESVRRGIFAVPAGVDIEAWIAERIDDHRNPVRPLERETADGRSLKIIEHRTSEGGIVGIVLDVTDQVRAEIDLRRVNTRMIAAIEAYPDAFAIYDADDRLVLCNSRYREVYAESAEAIVTGTPFEALLRHGLERGQYADAVGREDEWLAERLAAHRSASDTVEQRLGDGRWLMIRERRTPDGETVGVRTDITEIKTAEAALRESEERFRDFAASASDWLWETGPDLRFTYLSDQFEAMTGISPGDILGRTRAEVGKPDVSDLHWARHLDDLASRRPFRNFRYAFPTAGEAPVIFQIGGVPVYDEDGVFKGYRGTGSNVTAHVLAEQAAARSKALLHDAIESIGDGFAMFNAEDRLVLCNEAYRTALAIVDDILVPGVLFEDLFRALVARGHIRPPAADVGAWVEQKLADHRAGCATRTFANSDGRWIEVREYPMQDGGRALVRSDITESRRADATLRKLSQAVEQSPASVIVTDLAARIEYVNPKFTEMTGYAVDEVIGENPRILRSGHSERRVYETMWATLTSGRTWRGEFRNRRKDGTLYWCGCSVSPIKDHDGTITHYVGVQEDITGRKIAEERLRRSEERFRHLVESSVLGIVIDRDGKPLFANETYARIFGYDGPDDILCLDSLDPLYTPGDRARIAQYRRKRDRGEAAPSDYEFQGVKRDGSLIWAEAQVRRITWNGEPATQSTVVDVTLRKLYEEQLRHQANFDQLTDLPNRVLALDRLQGAIVQARRHGRKVGLLFIDIDHFKRINDTLGHAAGDRFLRQASVRISRCIREQDTVARLSGDEFLVILPDIHAAEDAQIVTHKILDAFEGPFVLDGQEAFVGASIGISVGPDDGDEPEALLRSADAAMYEAKVKGRNTFRHFTRELNERAMERVRLEADMRHGLERGEFSLAYQPLVDVASGRIVGAEALLRWLHPTQGLIRPDRFVPLAEDTGLIVPLGNHVLDTACAQAAAWRRAGLDGLRVTVNVSARQFRGQTLVDAVARALADNDLPPEALELEITEGLLMDDLPETSAALGELDARGIRLAVDDFGRGYSSLSYLKRFPVDTLKIDKSFIRDVVTDPGDVALVEAIIAMARSLELQVVAEGVESEDQLAFLRARACELAQGYLFSRPIDADEFQALFQATQGAFAIAG